VVLFSELTGEKLYVLFREFLIIVILMYPMPSLTLMLDILCNFLVGVFQQIPSSPNLFDPESISSFIDKLSTPVAVDDFPDTTFSIQRDANQRESVFTKGEFEQNPN
jgi:hypothetical protein